MTRTMKAACLAGLMVTAATTVSGEDLWTCGNFNGQAHVILSGNAAAGTGKIFTETGRPSVISYSVIGDPGDQWHRWEILEAGHRALITINEVGEDGQGLGFFGEGEDTMRIFGLCIRGGYP